MSNLKVGTKVRVKDDLIIDQKYGKEVFVNGMDKFLGIETEISGVVRRDFCWLSCDKDEFFWTPEMFDVIQ